jgi:predicted small integral membrane protein
MERKGFLPLRTTIGDRIFISAISAIAVHLLWMRFLERFASLWWATVLSFILTIIIIKRG